MGRQAGSQGEGQPSDHPRSRFFGALDLRKRAQLHPAHIPRPAADVRFRWHTGCTRETADTSREHSETAGQDTFPQLTAESVGFEPTVRLPPQRFSRPPPSATRRALLASPGIAPVRLPRAERAWTNLTTTGSLAVPGRAWGPRSYRRWSRPGPGTRPGSRCSSGRGRLPSLPPGARHRGCG
jgi:hypothetical protein